MDQDNRAVIVMWRTDTIGAILRLWTYDDRDRVVGSSELLIEREFLEQLLSEVCASRAAAADMTLF